MPVDVGRRAGAGKPEQGFGGRQEGVEWGDYGSGRRADQGWESVASVVAVYH